MLDDSAAQLSLTDATQLREEDRLRLKLSDETAQRMMLERQNIAMITKELGARAKKHAEESAKLQVAMTTKYGLTENDSVDLEAGTIMRAPKAKAPAAEAKPGDRPAPDLPPVGNGVAPGAVETQPS